MPPTLEHAFTLRIFLTKDDTLTLGPTKGGSQRFVAPLSHGFLSGSGVQADIISGGSDWPLFDSATGTLHTDVRTQARDKSSGDMIYIHYTGLVKMDEVTGAAFQWSPLARTTESKDHYFFAWPVFEVNSEKLKWMEQTAFVGHGHWHIPGDGSQAVEYDIYKLVTG